MILLRKDDVKRLITMDEAIAAVEQAYVSFSTGNANIPLRHNIQPDGSENSTLFMPGFLPELQGLGLKIVSIRPENNDAGLPVTLGVILLVDVETGKPLALMDATFLTALRTGAASGVATKYLAREDAASVALIGTGGMAPYQLEAVCCVRDIKEVYVYNRTAEKAELFAAKMKESFRDDLIYHVASTPEEAVKNADVVAAATTSSNPVVYYKWLKSGAHINAVGSYTQSMQEVDEELVVKADCKVVDSIAAASVSGDIAVPLQNLSVSQDDLIEIGNLIYNRIPGRTSPKDITYFKSVGIAAQDLAAAAILLNNAKSKGYGTEFDLI